MIGQWSGRPLPRHRVPRPSQTLPARLTPAPQTVLLAASLALAAAAPQYPAPVVAEAYPDLPPVYNVSQPKLLRSDPLLQYQYGVNDQGYSGSVFSQVENRDGANAGGEYRVNLPDGRVQIVTYTAGPEGYNAAVTYEGVAVYPDAPAAGYAPAPVLRVVPAPYVPAPAPVVKVVVAPAPYVPVPAHVVKVAPAPYVPAPAPVVKVAPVLAPAPYAPVVRVAPIAPAYAHAPLVHHPVVHHPVVHHPVVHHPVVHHAPTYGNSGYQRTPLAPKYSPKKYGYTVVAKAAPAEEARAAKAVEIEETVFEEEAAPAKAPAPLEEAAAVAEAVEVVEKVEAAVEAAEQETRYRYRFF